MMVQRNPITLIQTGERVMGPDTPATKLSRREFFTGFARSTVRTLTPLATGERNGRRHPPRHTGLPRIEDTAPLRECHDCGYDFADPGSGNLCPSCRKTRELVRTAFAEPSATD